MKTCSKCKTPKPSAHYDLDPGNTDNLKSACKACLKRQFIKNKRLRNGAMVKTNYEVFLELVGRHTGIDLGVFGER